MMEACIWLGAPIGRYRDTVGRFDEELSMVAASEISESPVVLSCATTQPKKPEMSALRSMLTITRRQSKFELCW